MSESSEYPRIVRDVKVYGNLRISIPTTMARDAGIKDGDTVRWIEQRQGTYILKSNNKGYRPFSV